MAQKLTFRALALLVGSLLAAFSLTGCGQESPQEAAVKTIDALPYLGEGTKTQFKERVVEAQDEAAINDVVADAQAVNGVVGPTLVNDYFGLDNISASMVLHDDGTVTGDSEVLAYMGSATHWRLGDTWIDLCTTDTCQYASAWKVEVLSPSQTVAKKKGFRFTLLGTDSDPAPTRDFYVDK